MIKNIVVLFSGNGTNLEAIIKELHNKTFNNIRFNVLAITNNPNAYGIKRAKEYGITPKIIDHRKFAKREDFDKVLVEEILKLNPSLVALAGFMRILTPIFTQKIKNAINIHPSLLPLFKGANAIKESFNSQMKVAGVTIHRVTQELDSGEIIAQECFNKENLSFMEFEAKIHQIEHLLYPKTILKLLVN